MKSSALSAVAVPTGSRGAVRYQGGMPKPSAPAPNAHRPVHRLRSGAFKNSSFFCIFPQSFRAFLNPLLQFSIHFSSKIIRQNCEKCRNLLLRVENHCTPGGVRAIGRCYGCGSISIVWFNKIRWIFCYARSQMSAVPPSASVP